MSPSPLVYATSDPDAPPPHSKLGRAACLLIVPGCLGYAGHYVIVTLDLRSPIANAFLDVCQVISFLVVLVGLTLAFAGLVVGRRRRLLLVVGFTLNFLLFIAWVFAPVRLKR